MNSREICRLTVGICRRRLVADGWDGLGRGQYGAGVGGLMGGWGVCGYYAQAKLLKAFPNLEAPGLAEKDGVKSFAPIALAYGELTDEAQQAVASGEHVAEVFAPVTAGVLAKGATPDVVGPDAIPGYLPQSGVGAFVCDLDGQVGASYFFRVVSDAGSTLDVASANASPPVVVKCSPSVGTPILLESCPGTPAIAKKYRAWLEGGVAPLPDHELVQFQNSVTIRWTLPGVQGPNLAFVVAIEAIGVPGAGSVAYKPIDAVKAVDGSWSATLGGLDHGTQYGICLRAQSDAAMGAPSKMTTIRLAEHAPPPAPQWVAELCSVDKDKQALHLGWQVTDSLVRVFEETSGISMARTPWTSDSTACLPLGVEPGPQKFRLQARGRIGVGPFGPLLTVANGGCNVTP